MKLQKKQKRSIILIVTSIILIGVVAFGLFKISPLGDNKASDKEDYKDKLHDYIKDNDDYLTQGNKNSKVQVVAFVDYRCSHCSDYDREIKQQKVQPKIDNNKIGYTEIPYPVTDAKSEDYAKMYKTFNQLGDVNLSEQFSKQAFETSTMDNDPVKTVKKINLPKDKEQKVIKKYKEHPSKNDKDKIRDELKISSTPTIFVNSHHVNEANNLIKIIDEKLDDKD